MKKDFCKDGLLCVRRHSRGETLYSSVTIQNEFLIQAIRSISERKQITPAKILQKYIEVAFEAGITPEL